MQLRFGSLRFQDAGLVVSTAVELTRTPQGLPKSHVVHLTCEGTVLGTGPTQLSAISAIYDASLAVTDGDLVLYDDAGRPTASKLLVAGSLHGVLCEEWGYPAYPGGAGDYVTGRLFRAAFSAEYPLGTAGAVLEIQETFRAVGNGGPKVLWQEAVDGPLYPVVVAQRTACHTYQEGSAVGYFARPVPPQPVWPQYLVNAETAVQFQRPRRLGLVPTEYPASWSFHYISPFPLTFPRGAGF